jgi:hypothetical protein
MVSHEMTATQAVTFYNATSPSGAVLLRVYVDPEQCPAYIRFGTGPGEPMSFSAGLTVDPGNCEVNVWSVG